MAQENRHPSISAFKYCPNCGHQSLANDSLKMINCQNCSFTFYLNPASAVALIIENSNSEILFTIRAIEPKKGMLDLPGGFVDPFETLEHAIKREVKEELDISITSMSFFGSQPNTYQFKDVIYQTVDAIFYTKISDHQTITLSDEIQEVKWIKSSEIINSQLAFSSIKKIISAFVEKK